MYFVILDTTLDLKAFKDYPELLKTEVSVRSERCCILIVEKHSSPAALHMRSFNMHAQKNTPDRCRSAIMCCDETVCDLPDLWVCVYSTFRHSGNMHQTMHERNETSKWLHCRCWFVSGLAVGIFRHLKIQFRFGVTIWFQNDSQCISIFPATAKGFSEILYYFIL